MKKLLPLTLIIFLSSTSAVIASTKKPLHWQIKNTAWTKSMDKSFEEFVAALGKGKKAGFCHTTSDCIKSPIANPKYAQLNPPGLNDVFSDCADLPYILKAYFSWMNDLPFAYTETLTPAPPRGKEAEALLAQLAELNRQYQNVGFFKRAILKRKIKALREQIYGANDTDIRYNRFGNNIVTKRYVKNGDNINQVLVNVANAISTATFRTDASTNVTGSLFRDLYPVAISRASIKPGTVLYDPNGHIAVVYEVTANGKVHLIDAHPDNSLTAITYGEKFSQTSVEIGGGFSNWRPFDVSSGVRAAANEELSDYSLEQFDRKKVIIFNNMKMSFHEYVRNKLSLGKLVYHPVTELKELMEEICNDVKERVAAVNAAIASGINRQAHPERLPANIYGTDGDWEAYSTPSRDARLKASVREGRTLMKRLIEGHRNNDPNVIYDGIDLSTDLLAQYGDSALACKIEIKKTNNQDVVLDLGQVLKNIFKLSFDPYHCVELRWGMVDVESMQSCRSSKENMDWYKVEEGLRNLIDRDYAVKMDYSLSELPSSKFGKIPQENISIEDVLHF